MLCYDARDAKRRRLIIDDVGLFRVEEVQRRAMNAVRPNRVVHLIASANHDLRLLLGWAGLGWACEQHFLLIICLRSVQFHLVAAVDW
eukprot:scaffold102866_cov49-Attheya_sp.AAC.1